MRGFRKLRSVATPLLLAGLSFVGVAAAQEPVRGGTLVVSPNYEAPSLDHLTSGTAHDALWSIYDRLVTVDLEGNYRPGLATSWEVSEDGRTVTFHLRDDAYFHNGDKVDAAAVKWFFDKARDPEGQHAFSSSYNAVASIEAPDETTVVFNLHEPWPFIFDTVSSSFSGIISPRAYEEAGDRYGVDVVVGSGPFVFESWELGGELVAVRNEDYTWGPEWLDNPGPAYVDRVVWRYFGDDATRLIALETGQVDVLYAVPVQQLDRIASQGRFDLYEKPRYGGATMYMSFNFENELFQDVRVRQALNHAINKEEVWQRVANGLGEPAYNYVPPTTIGALTDAREIGYEYDTERALELFAEAGWTRGDDGVLRNAAGEPFTFDFYARGETEFAQAAQIIQEQLRQIGIGVQLFINDSVTHNSLLREGVHDAGLQQYGWSQVDILQFYFPSRQIPYPNHSRYVDPVADDLLNRALVGPTFEDSIATYKEAQRYLVEQAVWVPIVYLMDNIAVSDKVGGFYVHPQNSTYLQTVYLTR